MTFQTVTSDKSDAVYFYPIPNTSFYYFYAFCQPQTCRSLFPLFDTPSIKSPLEVNLTIDENYIIYSNGEESGRREIIEDGIKKANVYFTVSDKIPSYSLGIVAAPKLYEEQSSENIWIIDMNSTITNRSEEANQTSMLFDQMQLYMGDFFWPDYKIAIMPPNFPFASLESPVLTLTSPTLFPGDGTMMVELLHDMAL